MAISIDQLPYDSNGSLDGTWLFQLRQNLHGGHGGAQFADGRTVSPVDARTFRQFVATMGPDIVGAYRTGDQFELGDVSTLRPNNYDELHSKSLEAQDSNKILADRELEKAKVEAGGDPVVAHALVGAKFESEQKQKGRKDFEEAAGRTVKETTEGSTTAVTGEGTTPDGGKVVEGGEPSIDPAAVDSAATDTATSKKKRW